LQRAFDQVVHDVATQNLPVTILIDRGGLVAEDGTTHHGAFDYAYLRHVPNMVVMAPKDENELQHMVKTCLSYEGPASVRYSRGSAWGVPMDSEPKALPIGRAELLRAGSEVLGLPDKFIEQGPQDLLRVQYGLTADGIYEEAKALYTMTVLGVGRR